MTAGRGVEDVAAAAESVRRWVDAATWTAIGLGLVFTAVNVQVFAAAGAPVWSPGWLVAWLLDPMVSVLLLAVVRAEQVTARWQVAMGWQVVAVKWAAFAATYSMNTWSAWRDGVPSSVLLHSVPPVFVLLAAEVAPALRERLTEAVRLAASTSPITEVHEPVGPPASNPVSEPLPAGELAASDLLAGCESSLPAEQHGTGATSETAQPDVVVDVRVVELAELLASGCDVTGAHAAALHSVSERTGRRLLVDARAHLEQHPIPSRPDLHLVEGRTAGGTA